MYQLTPPPHLYNNILSDIGAKKRLKQIKRAIALWVATFFASWTALIFFWQSFYRQADESGFKELSKLLLSDFSTVKFHLLDYLLSLAESLPAVSVGLLTLAVILIIGSAIKLAGSSMEFRQIKHS